MYQTEFTFAGSAAQIIFGRGAIARTADALAGLDRERALVLSTKEQSQAACDLARSLGKTCLGVYDKAVMHTPVAVTEDAMEVIAEQRVDCVISIGGGSTTGLGKAIALRTGLPQIAIPTTYAGSEVTDILGETQNGVKVTQKSPKVIPDVVLYDPDLTSTLPVEMSVASGVNALAHAVEALYARDRNPISTMMAAEGARAMIDALPMIAEDPQGGAGRDKALYGAWLCGAVLGQVGMALHHKLCHALGGAFNLPHAETHTVVLPHAAAFNACDHLAPIADALGGPVGPGLWDFAARLKAPMALKDLGMPATGIGKAVEVAMANPYWNPRPLSRDAIEALIAAAYHGVRPE